MDVSRILEEFPAPSFRGATYLADASLLDLFERARVDMPSWVAEQVDRMEQPDLPAFDPGAAVGDAGGKDARSSARTAGSAGAASGSWSSSGLPVAGGRPRARRRDSLDDHPLSDVWGDG